MDIILISIDCLRADHVGYTKDSKFEMPNLMKLVKKGYAYENCIAQAPFTTTSHVSMLTGLYPFEHGIRHLYGEKLSPEVKMIQHDLKDFGYSTHAVVSCFHMTHIGLENGFDSFDHKPSIKNDKFGRGNYNSAKVVTDKAIRILRNFSHTKNFLFLHYFDAHVHVGFEYEQMYKDQLLIIDQEIGRLIKNCNDRKRDTLFVITSDHGKKVYEGEHNFPYLNPRNPEVDPKPCGFDHEGEGGHGAELYDECVKVPLIVYSKGGVYYQETIHSYLIQVVDIPNLIKWELKSNDPDYETKSDLAYMETFSPDYLFDQGIPLIGIRTNEWKLICYQVDYRGDSRTFRTAELYDLKNDPEEKDNVISDNLKITNSLFKQLIDLDKTSSPKIGFEEDREDIKERLKDLGYI